MASQQEVALVTGASAGIGRAIAEALLAEGRHVVNLDYVLPDWSHPHLVSYQAELTKEAPTRERAAEIAAATTSPRWSTTRAPPARAPSTPRQRLRWTTWSACTCVP